MRAEAGKKAAAATSSHLGQILGLLLWAAIASNLVDAQIAVCAYKGREMVKIEQDHKHGRVWVF